VLNNIPIIGSKILIMAASVSQPGINIRGIYCEDRQNALCYLQIANLYSTAFPNMFSAF